MGLLQRLDAKLDRSGGPEACWPFRGAQSRGQHRETTYGVLREGPAGARLWRVPRLVLLLEDLPEEAFNSEQALRRWLHLANLHRRDQEAAHVCDNSICGNPHPKHLTWQSHEQNVAEQAERRAQAREADA